MGQYAEGLIWPLWLFVVYHLGEERWLHTDSAYTLFRILNHQALFYDRFACEFLVWPGQLLTALGAPISIVLQGLNLILTLMAWATWIAFARHKHRWILFLLIICGGSELFFIGYSEIGLCTWAFLCTLLLIDNPPKQTTQVWQTAGVFLCILILLFSHPAGWLYLPVIIALSLHRMSRKSLGIMSASLCIALILKSVIFPSNAYDSGLYQTLSNPETWLNFFQLLSVNYLLGASWFFIPAVTALACFALGLSKPWRWVSAAFFFIILSDTIVAVVIYAKGDAHINMEKFFYPIGVLALLSISVYLWGSQEPQHSAYRLKFIMAKQREISKSMIGILPWFLSINMLLGIQKYSPDYSNRKAQLQSLTASMPGAKMMAHYDTLSARIFPGSLWGLSYETALITAINKERTGEPSTLKSMKAMTSQELADWGETQKKIGDSLLIGAPFEMPQRIDRLNRRYFEFEQGTTYQLWNPAANR